MTGIAQNQPIYLKRTGMESPASPQFLYSMSPESKQRLGGTVEMSGQ